MVIQYSIGCCVTCPAMARSSGREFQESVADGPGAWSEDDSPPALRSSCFLARVSPARITFRQRPVEGYLREAVSLLAPVGARKEGVA